MGGKYSVEAKESPTQPGKQSALSAGLPVSAAELKDGIMELFRDPMLREPHMAVNLKAVEITDESDSGYTVQVIQDGKKLDWVFAGKGDGTDRVQLWKKISYDDSTQTFTIITYVPGWMGEISEDKISQEAHARILEDPVRVECWVMHEGNRVVDIDFITGVESDLDHVVKLCRTRSARVEPDQDSVAEKGKERVASNPLDEPVPGVDAVTSSADGNSTTAVGASMVGAVEGSEDTGIDSYMDANSGVGAVTSSADGNSTTAVGASVGCAVIDCRYMDANPGAELLFSMVKSFGYTAGTHSFLKPTRPTPAQELLQPAAMQALEALRAEFKGEMRAQVEEVGLVKAQLGEALGKIESMHEQVEEAALVKAQLGEAVSKIEGQKADLALLHEQVGCLMDAQRKREEEEAAAAQLGAPSEEYRAAGAKGWPLVEVRDVDPGTASAEKHISVVCPGTQEEDITIEELHNGVRVLIEVPDGSQKGFERDFCFDSRRDGFFELRKDELSYELGILSLILKAAPPKRIKLSSASRKALPPLPEEVESSFGGLADQPRPQCNDTLSVGSLDVDSQSAVSESWMHVKTDTGEWTCPGQDEASADKESLNEVSQRSSWAVPVDSRLIASRAPSSRSSGAASAATVGSVASAPTKITTPCCFPPHTPFRNAASGKYLRAVELKSAGGDRLLGPGGAEVLVRKAVKHPAVERDLVSLRLKGVSGALVVTADHRLLTRGQDGQPVTCSAGDLAVETSQGTLRCLYDGASFQEVERADRYPKKCEVVELTFDSDAVALAWVLPRRSHSSEARVSVAVRGKEPTLGDDFRVQRTFWCEPCASHSAAATRSLSVGAQPAPRSTWSVGSVGHDDRHPHRCEICKRHQGYLKVLHGPNPGNAVRCPDGAACKKCHGPHPEYKNRGRDA